MLLTVQVLEGVEMSTGSELDGILARVRQAGLSVKLLEPTFDVDEEEDLYLLRELASRREDLEATRSALEKLGFLEPEPAANTANNSFPESKRKNM